MKIWLAKNSEVSIREQLTTQITIGITSGDLRVGDKLPSTGELARRFKIHPNTVSGAYQTLAEKGWLEFRQGSGFYVCENENSTPVAEKRLENIVAEFLQKARENGFSDEEINASVQKRFAAKRPQTVFIVESDENLREILIGEISASAENFDVKGISFTEFECGCYQPDSVIAAFVDEKQRIENVTSTAANFIYLKSNSVANSMIGQERPAVDEIIAVVSGWESFLTMTKTILLAADITPECLYVRSTNHKNWQKGLPAASIIICDFLTAQKLADYPSVRPFRIVAEESLGELKKII